VIRIKQGSLMENTLTRYDTIKLDCMPALKLKQLQYESDTWKRLLGFMTEENIHLKNRLSEILKGRFSNNMLEEVEVFQNRFVREDELIGMLRNDVAMLDRLLEREIFEDGLIAKDIGRSLKNIRRNITIAEKQFGKLKIDFNSYLSENI
jgi:regulator of replication initiation timing